MNLSEFLGLEPSFSESMFLSKVNHVFIKIFSAIMFEKLDDVKHLMSDNVFLWCEKKIESARMLNGRQMYDELNVKSSRIVSIDKFLDRYEIRVFVEARYMDYIMDSDTSKIIRGQNERRIQKNYSLTFTKQLDAKEQKNVRKCPNCGASLDINNSGKCSFCHNVYNLEDYDWILSDIS